MEYLIQAGQLLLGISILVVLHEFGHYIAARAFKTKVESFYLFFNPWFSIWKKKIGDTEYGIGWLPLGGYVKIAGMIDESMDKEQLAKDPEPWEFRSKPTWQRLIIMLGGVIVNVIVAFVIYAMVLFTWGEKYIPANNATYGIYCDSLMVDLGFNHNDRIVALDGKPIDDDVTYGEIRIQLLLDGIKEVTVNRNSQKVNIAIPEDFPQTVLRVGAKELFTEEIPFVIDSLLPDNPAEKAGFMVGDKIVAINDIRVSGLVHSTQLLKGKTSEKVSFTVLRNNEEKLIDVTTTAAGMIGVDRKIPTELLIVKVKEYGFFESIPAGFYKTGNVIKRYTDQFKLIFSKEGVTQLGGFGTIAKIYGAEWIWQRFWEMTAMISVMLAVMNLLPIPALDGGHVMFLTYEMITRRKPHEKLMEYAQIGGMLLLLGFMLYANGMDVFRAVTG
ncbi:MAG: RIP metalloprotease RseP [Flavobacteriales bacterium]|nr:MAG: RIP metalloprotease RseP [Flavobacteriales bacterium]